MKRNVWSIEELARSFEAFEEAVHGTFGACEVTGSEDQAYRAGCIRAFKHVRKLFGIPEGRWIPTRGHRKMRHLTAPCATNGREGMCPFPRLGGGAVGAPGKWRKRRCWPVA